ncbi:MAG: hypothetical protein QF893_03920 [Alphaproteobacteria bacterium]|nr:hypothetical protein [Alphaproteobacteria bacterium]
MASSEAAPSAESKLSIENATLTLANSTLELPVRFRYRWRDIEVRAEVSDRDGQAVLRQYLDLGPVPYNAENPLRRRQHLDLVDQPLPIGRFAIASGQRLTLGLEHRLEAPLTGGSVVVAVTAALLDAAPYLPLVRDPRDVEASSR